jgi:hypothetical protein
LATYDDGHGVALFAGGNFIESIDSHDSFLAKWVGCITIPSPWTDLGFALPGILGDPLLVGTGDLTAGSAGTLTLSQAAPSALAILFLSISSSPATFKCGTLVPFPFLGIVVVSTSPAGDVPLAWDAWLPELTGFSIYFQYGIQDAAAPCGVALSNALRADVP